MLSRVMVIDRRKEGERKRRKIFGGGGDIYLIKLVVVPEVALWRRGCLSRSNPPPQ